MREQVGPRFDSHPRRRHSRNHHTPAAHFPISDPVGVLTGGRQFAFPSGLSLVPPIVLRNADYLVPAPFEQGREALAFDIRMPPAHRTEGLEAAQVIREQFRETALLVLSAHVEVEHAMRLLASGRRTGYVLKSRVTDVDEFLRRGGTSQSRRVGGRPRAGSGTRCGAGC